MPKHLIIEIRSALLGLVDLTLRELVIPDYEATQLEIYRDYSR
jgi:hypothetical protein